MSQPSYEVSLTRSYRVGGKTRTAYKSRTYAVYAQALTAYERLSKEPATAMVALIVK